MPAIAELLDRATADKLAAVRAQAADREDQAAATPVLAVCKSCGQHLPPPAAVFRDGRTR